jgi:hypothetical protein
MKARFLHKSLKSTILFPAFISVIVLMSSCSRNMTSLTRANKMQYASALTVNHHTSSVQTQVTAPVKVNDIKENTIAANSPVEAGTSARPVAVNVKHGVFKGKHGKIKMPVIEVTQLSRQLALKPLQIKQSNQMGYHHVSLEGYLRTAVICLIIGLILGIFTILPGIGYIFGLIGGIFVLIGLIFLILWLIENV